MRRAPLDRFHNLRIQFCPRVEHAKFIVKNLAHQRRVTKDASRHGHRDGSGVVLREEVADYDGGHVSEFPARIAEHLRSQFVLAGSD